MLVDLSIGTNAGKKNNSSFAVKCIQHTRFRDSIDDLEREADNDNEYILPVLD